MAQLMEKHPNMSSGQMKEHRFFSTAAGELLSPDEAKQWQMTKADLSVDAYKGEFTVGCDVQMTFDASPGYWAMGHKNLAWMKIGTRQPPGTQAVEEVKKVL